MTVQRTLSIIKPDAVGNNVIGDILRRFEENGLSIIAARMTHLSPDQAGRFYAVHQGRPFYNDPGIHDRSEGLRVYPAHAGCAQRGRSRGAE